MAGLMLAVMLSSGSAAGAPEAPETPPGVPGPPRPADSPVRNGGPDGGLPLLRMTPSVALIGQYDSNVNFTTDEQDDLVLIAMPELRLTYSDRRTSLAAGYRLQAEAYADQTELNTLSRNHVLEGELAYRLTPRLDTSQSGSLAYSRDPTFDQIVAGRRKYWAGSYASGFTYRVLPRVSGFASYRLDGTNFVDARLVDQWAHALELAALLRVTARDTFSPEYRVRLFQFAHGLDSWTHALGAGYERRLAPGWRVRVALGRLFYHDDVERRLDGYTAGVELEGRWEPMVAELRYDRDLAAVSGLEGLFWTHTLTASVRSRGDSVGRLGWDLETQHRWQQATEETADPDIQTVWFRATLSLRATRNLLLNAGYTLLEQTTAAFDGGSDESVVDHRVLLGIVLTHSFEL